MRFPICFLLLLIQPFVPLGNVNAKSENQTDADVSAKLRKAGPDKVTSIEAMTVSKTTATSLALSGEYAALMGNYDQAISTCRRALQKGDDDADIHEQYAEALEGKLRLQTDPNPALLHECTKEWLTVLRNERGAERGLNIHGIGIFGIEKLFQDEEHTIDARRHLFQLTGSIPRPWETDRKYLTRVQSPATLSVKAEISTAETAFSDIKEKAKDHPLLWMEK